MPYLGVGRLFLAIFTFVFAVYLFTGLLGAPLKSISALLPPPTVSSQPIGSAQVQPGVQVADALCGPAKYADKLHLPQGLQGYFEYEQGYSLCQRTE